MIWVNGRLRYAHHIALELAGWILPFEWSQVLHSCDNPPCVNPAHLRIGTAQDDADDKVSKGRQSRTRVLGERHGKAKLQQVDVEEIRRLCQPGVCGRGVPALARKFMVSRWTIRDIIKRKYWRHVA